MTSTLGATDRKAQESAGNGTQAGFPFLAVVAAPMLLQPEVVQRITFSGALSEAARHCGMSDQDIAAQIHVSGGYFSRFLRGVGQQWARRLVAYMRVTQCLAPLQWIADQMGCDITPRDVRAAEVAALKARLKELEKAA